MLPSIVAATLGSVAICCYFGLKERKRLGTLTLPTDRPQPEFRDEDWCGTPGRREGRNRLARCLQHRPDCFDGFPVADVAPLVVLFIIAFSNLPLRSTSPRLPNNACAFRLTR